MEEERPDEMEVAKEKNEEGEEEKGEEIISAIFCI